MLVPVVDITLDTPTTLHSAPDCTPGLLDTLITIMGRRLLFIHNNNFFKDILIYGKSDKSVRSPPR